MEYRAENLTLDCLMAFALTDDRKRQMKVYRSLKDSGLLNPRAIRAALTEEMAEAGSKLAKFVGLDAYHAAGGVSRSDLFGDQVYLENPGLLHQLVADKLDGVRKELARIDADPRVRRQFVDLQDDVGLLEVARSGG